MEAQRKGRAELVALLNKQRTIVEKKVIISYIKLCQFREVALAIQKSSKSEADKLRILLPGKGVLDYAFLSARELQQALDEAQKREHTRELGEVLIREIDGIINRFDLDLASLRAGVMTEGERDELFPTLRKGSSTQDWAATDLFYEATGWNGTLVDWIEENNQY